MISFAFASSEEEKSLLVQVYIKTNKVLFGQAKKILKDSGLAEDAVQEAFIRLGHNLDKIDSPDSNKTLNYMVTIVKHISIDIYNKNKKATVFSLEDYDEDIDSTEETVEELVIRQEEYGLLKEAIVALNDTLREPLILQITNGMKEKEIAETLGISVSNVGARLTRAKQKIRQYMNGKEAGKDE